MILARTAYLHAIHERLVDDPVVALPGPRQVGKTTLARLYAESLGDILASTLSLSPRSSLRLPCQVCSTTFASHDLPPSPSRSYRNLIPRSHRPEQRAWVRIPKKLLVVKAVPHSASPPAVP